VFEGQEKMKKAITALGDGRFSVVFPIASQQPD
jgi:hypothetical protein